MPSPPVIAVVGAGFSGVMVALNLLRRPASVKLVLFDRQSPMGLGAAYATDDPVHRLNVRAGNMSAWSDRPNDFVDWLQRQGLAIGPGDFAARGDYGRYLQSQLADLAEGPQAAGRLMVTPDEITAIEPLGARWRLTCAMGRTITADAVVLALGNSPPGAPSGIGAALEGSDAYVGDPWRWNYSNPSSSKGPLLLLGSGLTMIDVALSLDRAAPDRPLIALSRRGLTPREHQGAPPSPPPAGPLGALSPLEAMGWLRAAAEQQGWRTAVDALRPMTQTLWRHWSLDQRASFLRHARAFWDVHRHRLSPQVAQEIVRLRAEGRLRVLAGKLDRIDQLSGGGVGVAWRPRGETQIWRLEVDKVVNCTGPSTDLERSTEPLISALAKQGLIRADPLRLGLDVDADHRVRDSQGRSQRTLFAVGPITRGALWEINAVPDIRVQAAEAAASLHAAFAST